MKEVPIEELRANFCYTPTTGVVIHKIRKGDNALAMQPAGGVGSNGYLRTLLKGRFLYNHRVAFALFHGRWPDGQLDHINRNRLDNRIENLREASNAENQRNAGKPNRNTSGIRGVSWDKSKGRWRVRIRVGGNPRHLGLFANLDDAHLVRLVAEHAYWGGIHRLGDDEQE